MFMEKFYINANYEQVNLKSEKTLLKLCQNNTYELRLYNSKIQKIE